MFISFHWKPKHIKQWENSLALTPAWQLSTVRESDIKIDQDIKIKVIKIFLVLVLLTFSISDVFIVRYLKCALSFSLFNHQPAASSDLFCFLPLAHHSRHASNHKNLCWVTKTCVTIKYTTRDGWGWIWIYFCSLPTDYYSLCCNNSSRDTFTQFHIYAIVFKGNSTEAVQLSPSSYMHEICFICVFMFLIS